LRPVALLLDFGGVLADAPPQRPAPPELVLRIYNLINSALTPGQIQRALTDGDAAYARWRDENHPEELGHVEFWDRFVIGDWPRAAQVLVRASASKLAYDWAYRNNWALRPGIREALAATAAAGVPMAVVSNTLCGAAHRDFLTKAGVGKLFAAQIYSDEAGVRKPNPQLIWNATDELGVAPGSCWFVGDSPHRDMAGARRAEVGTAILMRSPRTDGEMSAAGVAPDAIVEDGFGLLELLTEAGI
jgi:HAD superfamily hydrolase (TIGR01549 family)